jgi:peptide/nickel transport system ATP-binding protein
MKAGAFVEGGPVTDVVDHPQHPYTQKLLGAIPELGPWEDPGVTAPLVKEASHG